MPGVEEAIDADIQLLRIPEAELNMRGRLQHWSKKNFELLVRFTANCAKQTYSACSPHSSTH